MTAVAQEQKRQRMQTQDDISPVAASEIPRLVAVWEASARATHHFLTEADFQFFKPLVGDELAQLQTLLCVRDAAGQVVGFIGVEGDEVESLFIHPDWRGQGIGRRLLTYAIETLGATRLDVNEQNDEAIGFYRRMGFVVDGRSEDDGLGRPFPIVHMRLSETAR
jgi:putative acetyltransferase